MSAPLRFGLVGLGEMGRHHARVLRQVDGIELIGAADPTADAHWTLGDAPLDQRLDDLLARSIDVAIVAAPSIHHESIAGRLADAGVHVLIEKPLAPTSDAARRIRERFEGSGLIAVVGHVERFNPAVMELRARLERGELGRPFAISTKRVGPYPLRIRDVGVTLDLAIHDIDMVRWLDGPIETLSSQTAHRMGGLHEDLLIAVGRLKSGCVVSFDVNWLTPNKQRTLTVVGERGALVADLLRSELTLHANADVPTEWDEMLRLKGVSEGDTTRFALHQREPLVTQAEHVRDAIRNGGCSRLASLDDGIAAVEIAQGLVDAAPVALPLIATGR